MWMEVLIYSVKAPEESAAGQHLFVYENTPKELLHLPPKSWFKDRHSWSIVVKQLRLVLRLYANN